MKIISWNVNGIRAVIKKGFLEFLKKEKPDIICLQEIKISDEARIKERFNFPGYEEYWNSAQRPGYSGTAMLVKSSKLPACRRGMKVESDKKGMGEREFDIEGRVQTIEFEKFFLVNTYFPNANHELSRLDYKLRLNDKLLRYLKKLEKTKSVVITGDFNVAHEEIDLARPKDNVGNPGFTHEERDWMTKFINSGFVDTFRYLHKDKQQYTWWSYRFNARVKNIGWRIDYFCVSAKLMKQVKASYVLDKVMGSDHCPIVLEI